MTVKKPATATKPATPAPKAAKTVAAVVVEAKKKAVASTKVPEAVAKGKPQPAKKAKADDKNSKLEIGDVDLSSIEADLEGEPVAAEADTAKAKPLRMKVSRKP